MSTWITNAWYVRGWDAEIDSTPMARTICGVPMLFYRKLRRSVVAIIDVGVAAVDAGATLERHDLGVRGIDVDCMTPESETRIHFAILANPDLKLNAYNIDQGGRRARQVIARLMRQQAREPAQ